MITCTVIITLIIIDNKLRLFRHVFVIRWRTGRIDIFFRLEFSLLFRNLIFLLMNMNFIFLSFDSFLVAFVSFLSFPFFLKFAIFAFIFSVRSRTRNSSPFPALSFCTASFSLNIDKKTYSINNLIKTKL